MRPIWLILPVVICFFQGLSHANVSGLGDSRGDCVRLIKRLIVYPTEGASVLSDGITALTGQLIPGRHLLCHPTTLEVILGSGVKDAIGRNKNERLRAVVIVDAGQCSGSIHLDALLDEFTTYQVEGSVVDYLASDG